MAADRYDVHISLETDEPSNELTQLLVDELGGDRATVARAGTVSRDDGHVVVDFYELADEPPVPGAHYAPPRPEEPTEAPGRRAIEELQELHDEPTPWTPVARAMVALSAARARSGLSPSQRVTIRVEPSSVHHQEELRHS